MGGVAGVRNSYTVALVEENHNVCEGMSIGDEVMSAECIQHICNATVHTILLLGVP